MGPLNKYMKSSLLLIGSSIMIPQTFAATTEIKANIVDGICNVALDTATIVFGVKNSSQFSTGTAGILPLNVNLSCENTAGLSPSLKITGESNGLSDTDLFRSASSTAQYVGFMLKQGTLNDIATFYGAEGTVSPGQVIPLDTDDGNSVQAFSIGLVRGANDPMFTNGTVNAKITFAFVFP